MQAQELEQEEEYLDEGDNESSTPQVADLMERRRQMLARLRQEALPSGGRSEGGSFQRGEIAPVQKAAVTEYQVPVQYLPAHRGTDWIALAVPLSGMFTVLVLGGMMIMSSNAPREHDAYALRTTVDALKIVAERQPTTTINACLAFCGGSNQPAAPIAQLVAQPLSPQDWLNQFNQQLAQKQAQGIDITPDQTIFQQWLGYWESQAANGNLQAHAQSLQPHECQANIAMCAALGRVMGQQQQFGQYSAQPQQISTFQSPGGLN